MALIDGFGSSQKHNIDMTTGVKCGEWMWMLHSEGADWPLILCLRSAQRAVGQPSGHFVGYPAGIEECLVCGDF